MGNIKAAHHTSSQSPSFPQDGMGSHTPPHPHGHGCTRDWDHGCGHGCGRGCGHEDDHSHHGHGQKSLKHLQ